MKPERCVQGRAFGIGDARVGSAGGILAFARDRRGPFGIDIHGVEQVEVGHVPGQQLGVGQACGRSSEV